MGSQNVTVDQLLADICAALDLPVAAKRPEGEGWFTIAEIAAAKNMNRDTVHTKVNRLVDAGRMEKSERFGLIYYYRLK